jgi:hypothetical protein
MRHKDIERKLIYREHFLALAVTSLELMNVISHWI